ncbi:MAG: hypothetical protein R8G60_15265 [Roseovarius pacificus]|nr:hypothetical protein [Roseovarius pacificus]
MKSVELSKFTPLQSKVLKILRRFRTKEPPVGVYGSKFSTWDNCVFAGENSSYPEVEKIIGKHNHGDCLHLERHIASGRDVFVTDDNDFLSKRTLLEERFEICILTIEELEARFPET